MCSKGEKGDEQVLLMVRSMGFRTVVVGRSFNTQGPDFFIWNIMMRMKKRKRIITPPISCMKNYVRYYF